MHTTSNCYAEEMFIIIHKGSWKEIIKIKEPSYFNYPASYFEYNPSKVLIILT
jgi:hypothetical protein